jgi:hypothetical protein
MIDVQRYIVTDTPDCCIGGNKELVLASDYDALAAELAETKELAEAQAASAEKAWNKVRDLEAALREAREGVLKYLGKLPTERGLLLAILDRGTTSETKGEQG